jgi:hypothetical protein
MKKNMLYFLIGAVIIIGIFCADYYLKRKEFSNNRKILHAKIIGITPGGKSGIDVNYQYSYSSTVYSDSRSEAQYSNSIGDLVNDNRTIWVLIDSLRPNKSYLLLDRTDYEKFNITPTDSVTWIFKYTGD